jgi:hypothetical protein
MSLGASVLPIFEQLGMLEDFKKICLPCYSADMYNDKIEPVGSLNMKGLDKLYVYQNTPTLSPLPSLSVPVPDGAPRTTTNKKNMSRKKTTTCAMTAKNRNKKPERCFIWL